MAPILSNHTVVVPSGGASGIPRPIHNQVEIYFSVIQRKVPTPNDFSDLAEVESRLAAFERRYEQAAAPFEWRFTRDDLAQLMKKLADTPDYQLAA